MSASRREYLKDLLNDAMQVCEEVGLDPEDQGPVIASLILSDSLNGLRKALLTPHFVLAQQAAARAELAQQFTRAPAAQS